MWRPEPESQTHPRCDGRPGLTYVRLSSRCSTVPGQHAQPYVLLTLSIVERPSHGQELPLELRGEVVLQAVHLP